MENKLWHCYTRKYYSVIKRNRLLIHTAMWMDLKSIMLNEITQIQNYILYDSTSRNSRKGKIT